MDSKKPVNEKIVKKTNKCEKCGSENMDQKDKYNWVCKDCWHVQKSLSKYTYTYPLDPYPAGNRAKRRRY